MFLKTIQLIVNYSFCLHKTIPQWNVNALSVYMYINFIYVYVVAFVYTHRYLMKRDFL